MDNHIKNRRMAQIAKTLFPEKTASERLTFNQVQAIQFLTRTGDIQKFNSYCASCKMTDEEIEECKNEVTVDQLNLGEKS